MEKLMAVIIVVVLCVVGGLVAYNVTHETIDAGYVGYVYDRDAGAEDNVIPHTSVLNEARTGRISVNPITQDVLVYPTSQLTYNFTGPEEGDWGDKDMSITVTTNDGKQVDFDVYVSIMFTDIPTIIQRFATKPYEDIITNDIYSMIRGKLNAETQKYSVYDVTPECETIRVTVEKVLASDLMTSYGIDLKTFEIAPRLPADIQQKIDEKTQAQNAVELARLEREKQNEVNQQIVDQQKAESERELTARQAAADAAAYELERQAEAQLAVAEAEKKIAEANVEIARLEKEAELEKQQSYTSAYFRDKELDVQKAAVEAINPSIQTIITSGDGEGYEAIFGLKEIFGGTE